MPRCSVLLGLIVVATASAAPEDYFAIKVVDEATGRGVPLVELRTVNGIRYVTDSNGLVAFYEPGLMNQDVFFAVSSHGYEFPKDGFGFRGKKLTVTPGGSATLTIKRLNLAERLYRVTGGGIYHDSMLLGQKTALKEPTLNGQVLGSDSVLNAVHRGKLYWFWGDTNRPSYPLGNFNVPGATSALPAAGGLAPDAGVNLGYFLDDRGFAKAVAPMPGRGPTWLTTLIPLRDARGEERLYGSFIKVEPPMKVYARGLMVFDEAKQEFMKLTEIDMASPVFPNGHAIRHRDTEGEFVWFAHPFPLTRVRATAEDFQQMNQYQTWTCLKEDTSAKDAILDRDEQGRLRYKWRKNAPALTPADEARLLSAGKLKEPEIHWQLRDRATGKRVQPHSGSVYWNDYRKRWIMIAVEHWGTSLLGEVWYAEADTPVGPWAYAVKVVTHDKYSFYNPKQHPMFDADGGRVIYFEGTYTHTFSGNNDPTPRYDYNQVMYRLTLSDPRLTLPVAIYDISPGRTPERFASLEKANGKTAPIAFFALDRPGEGTVAVLADAEGLRLANTDGDAKVLFHALPPDTLDPPAATRFLYEYRHKNGARRAYSIDPQLNPTDFQRAEKPLCRVWKP